MTFGHFDQLELSNLEPKASAKCYFLCCLGLSGKYTNVIGCASIAEAEER